MVGEIFGYLAFVLALAFLAETLVEAFFGRIIDNVPQLAKFRWALVYLAVAVGLGGAFVYQIDLLYILGKFVEAPVKITPYGLVITGVAIGMGAAYIHQFISKFFPAKQPAPTPPDEHSVRSYG
jgi:F0F1-type ATP synthase assembly protein I